MARAGRSGDGGAALPLLGTGRPKEEERRLGRGMALGENKGGLWGERSVATADAWKSWCRGAVAGMDAGTRNREGAGASVREFK